MTAKDYPDDTIQHNTIHNISYDLLKAAFNTPNNRSVVFEAVRDNQNEIIDFRLTLLSKGTHDFFMGNDYTGKTIIEISPDQTEQVAVMKKVVETGIINSWVRYYENLNGEERWIKTLDSKLGDGIFRVWEDITAQKIAEKKLDDFIAEQVEAKYLALFNSTSQGFCIIEMLFDKNDKPCNYRFIELNPAFEKQTGLKDAKGKTIREISPNHEEHWYKLYGQIAKTGEPMYFEQESKHLSAEWYEVSAFPMSDKKDNKVAVIFTDITARKKAQQELKDFNTRLEQQVQERTATLNKVNSLLKEKNEELEKSNKELESFNYIASHDLQEPLRKIQTFISFIKDRNLNPQDTEMYINKIHASASRMTQLIQDVLIYSKLSDEKQFTKVDLNEVLDMVLIDYELLITEKNIQIIKDKLPAIKAIPLQIEQLFSNLVSNAIKYSNPAVAPVITISCKANDDNTITISFSDNGIGFDEKYSEQIFKLFQRLHGKTDYAGTGIGLSICKKITEQHSGSISAKSVLGKGATFNIILPIK